MDDQKDALALRRNSLIELSLEILDHIIAYIKEKDSASISTQRNDLSFHL